jgi:hypothetical protein
MAISFLTWTANKDSGGASQKRSAAMQPQASTGLHLDCNYDFIFSGSFGLHMAI